MNMTCTQCTFCDIVDGAAPAYIVYETPLILAFLGELNASHSVFDRLLELASLVLVPARYFASASRSFIDNTKTTFCLAFRGSERSCKGDGLGFGNRQQSSYSRFSPSCVGTVDLAEPTSALGRNAFTVTLNQIYAQVVPHVSPLVNEHKAKIVNDAEHRCTSTSCLLSI